MERNPAMPVGSGIATPAVQLLLFSMHGQRFAFDLAGVERVVRAVALTVVPGLPPAIRGIFSFHGRIVPVGDLHQRLGFPRRDPRLDDWLVVLRTSGRFLGVLLDGAGEVLACPTSTIEPSETVFRESHLTRGIARVNDDVVLIQDLAKFLSIEETLALDGALDAHA